MVAELIIASETEQDIVEVYAWYEGRRTGMGEEYLSCVDACIEAIRLRQRCMLSFTRTIAGGWCAAFRMRSSTSMQKVG